jgi:Kef-type K+ transport system membrane component KefB
MAVASTRIIKKVEEFVDKLEIIFDPLFFAVIGAQVNLTGINTEILILSVVVVAVAIVSKLAGCGLPSLLFLKDKSKAMIVGIGMISGGEVGLIVAGIGVTSGVFSPNIITTVIIMIGVTTLITPIWLKRAYHKEQIVSDDAKKSR